MSHQLQTIRLNMLVFDGTHERTMHQLSPFDATNASNGGNLSSQKFTWRMQMSRNVAQPGGVSADVLVLSSMRRYLKVYQRR